MNRQEALARATDFIRDHAIQAGFPAAVEVELVAWDTPDIRLAEVDLFTPDPARGRPFGQGASYMQSDPECLGLIAAVERLVIEYENDDPEEILDAEWRVRELF